VRPVPRVRGGSLDARRIRAAAIGLLASEEGWGMTEFLETMVDKFTFKVAQDRLYSDDGMWVKPEGGNRVLVGVTDFYQQRNGDVAFAEIKPVGTALARGEELGTIETIKVNLELVSPVSGEIVEVNPVLDLEPEHINQDPYGSGWLILLEASAWEGESASLVAPDAYFAQMKKEAQEEAGTR
jgi:glycine cleavage system H protein